MNLSIPFNRMKQTPSTAVVGPHRGVAAALALTAIAALAPLRLQAQDLAAAEAAFQRNDHAGIVRTLLPAWRKGELRDPRALYLLSRGCYFQQPTPLQLLRRQICNGETGRITIKAAQAGSIEAMLDLSYSLHRPDPLVAHPDLRPNSAQAYGWAMLALNLAADAETEQRAGEATRMLFDHIIATTGNHVPHPVLVPVQAAAQQDFLRLVPQIRPDLLAPAEGLIRIDQFKGLGWLGVPGTEQFHEFKEGDDQVYALSLQRVGDRIRFDAHVNGADAYRYLQLDGDCTALSATILRDTDWLWYGEDDDASTPAYPSVEPTAWHDEGSDVRAIVDFACQRAEKR